MGAATIAGSGYYFGTAKKLKEEGIDPRARVAALPVAAKALAVSTVLCGVVGVAAYYGLKHSGLQWHEDAQVSTVHDAVAFAEQQRNLVRNEFQKKLHDWEEGQERKPNVH